MTNNIDELFKCLYNANHDLKVIEFYYMEESTKEQLLSSPNVIKKGRWFYYQHKNKTYYIRLIKVNQNDETKIINVDTLLKNFRFNSEETKTLNIQAKWEE